MRIAILDDDKEFMLYLKDLINNQLGEYREDFKINTLCDFSSFKKASDIALFDYLFLDIDMPGMDGFKVAKTFKGMENRPEIIFVSNHDELVFDSFDFAPMRFVRKQYIDIEISSTIQTIVENFLIKSKVLEYKIDGNVKKIDVSDIVYLEHSNHNIKMYLRDEIMEFRGKISEQEDDLKDFNFVRCHIGFLVNLEYIECVERGTIILKNNITIPISRNRMNDTKTAFENYMMRNIL